MQKFMEILLKFDEILTKLNLASPQKALREAGSPLAGCANLARMWKFCQNFAKNSSNSSKIFINFCIQYSIFQHFSKSTHFCKILQKILQNFAKFLRISENFAKFCKICQKMSKFLQNFPIFWQKFPEFAREKVIFL